MDTRAVISGVTIALITGACGAQPECSLRLNETQLEVGQLADSGEFEPFSRLKEAGELRVTAGPQGAIMAVLALRLLNAGEGSVFSRIEITYPEEGFNGTIERASGQWQSVNNEQRIWPSVFILLAESGRGLQPGRAADTARLQGASVTVNAMVRDSCAVSIDESSFLRSKYVQ